MTSLVTAKVPNAARDGWAREREPWIWQQFLADAAIVRAGAGGNAEAQKAAEGAFHRWFGNAGDPPPGWPDELGYWVGMRIAERYVAQARDPHVALDELIAAADPAAILKASGYGTAFAAASEGAGVSRH